jgi:hydrogenase expression/formation protein HypD
MKVPGSVRGDDLRRRKAMGADVRLVYSPMDALEIAKSAPNRQVVFLGVGFETTAPGTALAVLEARERNLSNFTLLSLLKRTPPALHALMERGDAAIDALLCPGHVATVLGADAFDFLPTEHHLPAVVAGFEAGDLLAALYLLLRQHKEGIPQLENEYTRAVSAQGNPAALAVMEQVFTPCDDLWRGLGAIADSGLRLKEEFADYDAAKKYGFAPALHDAPSPCRCGDVICGRISPQQCPLFGKVCTPDDPVGPCMVSGEGACAAAYHYGGSL